MVGTENPAAGKRNPANAETKGGVTGEVEILLLPDDRKAYRAASDPVRPYQTAQGAKAAIVRCVPGLRVQLACISGKVKAPPDIPARW